MRSVGYSNHVEDKDRLEHRGWDIDIHQVDKITEKALTALIHAAIALNES